MLDQIHMTKNVLTFGLVLTLVQSGTGKTPRLIHIVYKIKQEMPPRQIPTRLQDTCNK